MNRRGFLQGLIGAGLIATADPKQLLTPAAPKLALRKDAFTGVSMKMIRTYDVKHHAFINRMDVLYGWQRVYNGNLSAMIDADTLRPSGQEAK